MSYITKQAAIAKYSKKGYFLMTTHICVEGIWQIGGFDCTDAEWNWQIYEPERIYYGYDLMINAFETSAKDGVFKRHDSISVAYRNENEVVKSTVTFEFDDIITGKHTIAIIKCREI